MPAEAVPAIAIAHATASDALWAGLPVLTCMGNGFAARVAASLLRAAGLPELVTASLAEYEGVALKLAREPETLRGLRERLVRAPATQKLFDTEGFTRIAESDMFLMPDLSTYAVLPWESNDFTTARVICWVFKVNWLTV